MRYKTDTMAVWGVLEQPATMSDHCRLMAVLENRLQRNSAGVGELVLLCQMSASTKRRLINDVWYGSF